jgi:hypothetical protein
MEITLELSFERTSVMLMIHLDDPTSVCVEVCVVMCQWFFHGLVAFSPFSVPFI